VVETGEPSVTLKSADATATKIDFKKGKINVSTANGITQAYLRRLNTFNLGTIVRHNIALTITEGGSPFFL
jgi:predicted aspartyl protease